MTYSLTYEELVANFALDGEDVVRLATGGRIPHHTNAKGYRNVSLGRKKSVGLHRLKFALAHGWLPPRVDHKDGQKPNNLLSNLRAATQSTNMQNQPAVHRRRELPRGVHRTPSGRLFAKWWNGHRYVSLGTYDDATAASAAVEEKLKEHHGEFYAESN